jgi:hypothetical protein
MNASARRLLFACLVLPACSVDTEVGTLVHEDPAWPPERPSPLGAGRTPALALFDRDGRPVVASTSDGAVIARGELDGVVIDAAFVDGDVPSVAVHTAIDEDGGGHIDAFELDDGVLAGPLRVADVAGEVRLVGSPFGVVTIQEDLGQRWRLIPSAGGFTPSVACGRPLSVRTTRVAKGGIRLEALSRWPEGELGTLQVSVDRSGVRGCGRIPIEGAGAMSDDVRMIGLGPVHARALVDLRQGWLEVAALDGHEVTGRARVAVAAERIEAALTVAAGPERALVAALASSPATLVVVGVDAGAASLVISDAVAVPLPGEVTRADGWFSRDLVAVRGSVYAATSEGVFAFDVAAAAGHVTVSPRAAFDGSSFRGPMEVVAW